MCAHKYIDSMNENQLCVKYTGLRCTVQWVLINTHTQCSSLQSRYEMCSSHQGVSREFPSATPLSIPTFNSLSRRQPNCWPDFYHCRLVLLFRNFIYKDSFNVTFRVYLLSGKQCCLYHSFILFFFLLVSDIALYECTLCLGLFSLGL